MRDNACISPTVPTSTESETGLVDIPKPITGAVRMEPLDVEMVAPDAPPCSIVGRWARAAVWLSFRHVWLMPLVISLVASGALIERKFGLFKISFLSNAHLTSVELPLFALASMVIDLTAIATLAVGWGVICRLLHRSRRFFAATFVVFSTIAILAGNAISYSIFTYLGDVLQIKAAINMAGGISGTVPYVIENLVHFWWVLLGGIIATSVAVLILYRLGRGLPDSWYRGWRVAGYLTVLWIAAGMVEAWAGHYGMDPISVNLRRTCLDRLVATTFAFATDFDGDHQGWIDFPPDFAPFDHHRHSFAPDIPGNGVDENGIGGDLPMAVVPEGNELPPAKPISTPDVLLIVPCSLRSDAVYGGELGSGDMPWLRAQAQKHFGTPRAYSHNGYTTSSVQTVLSGRLVKPNRSLVTEFQEYGYQVGVFSVHDERFGQTRQCCAFDKADRFFDASMDPDSRVTQFTAPSSMIIPVNRILVEMRTFLQRADANRPMFTYVYLATTHFSYDHDSQRNLVPHTPLNPSQMTPSRRREIVQLYRNAAANLDRQLAEIMTLFEQVRSPHKPVMLVIGDHGESLFDDGTLGHGLLLSDQQMRVPLVIVNGWGKVPVPFSLADVRPYLLNLLNSQAPSERRVTAMLPTRPIFQWIGPWRMPLYIAHRWGSAPILASDGLGTAKVDPMISADLMLETFTDLTSHTASIQNFAADPSCQSLVHHWESLRMVP